MKIYKIQHAKTGLYSRGGTSVSSNGQGLGWNKSGKIWDSLGKLRAHITTHLPDTHRSGTNMSDWRIITYELITTEAQTVDQIITKEKLIRLLTANSE